MLEWHQDPILNQWNLFERDIISDDLIRPIPGGKEIISTDLLGKEYKRIDLDALEPLPSFCPSCGESMVLLLTCINCGWSR